MNNKNKNSHGANGHKNDWADAKSASSSRSGGDTSKSASSGKHASARDTEKKDSSTRR